MRERVGNSQQKSKAQIIGTSERELRKRSRSTLKELYKGLSVPKDTTLQL